MSELHVGVGSQNKVKISATEDAFASRFPKNEIVVHGYYTESGVSAQPLSRVETLLGAKNRANSVKLLAEEQNANLNYAVGLEGGVDLVLGENGYEFFSTAFLISLGGMASIGFSSSRPLALPPAVMVRLLEGEEMGDVVAQAFDEIVQDPNYGLMGVLTDGEYTRRIALSDAVAGALDREAIDGGLRRFVQSFGYDTARYIRPTVRYTD